MTLAGYAKKRNFRKTPEPAGGRILTKATPLQFVVQKHAASRLHYDFRLELEGVLKSWAIPKGPTLDPKVRHLAMLVEDHPLEYATFEGTIPEGNYGAGNVIVWDRGTYGSPGERGMDRKEAEKELAAGFTRGDMKFVLHGQKLKGEFALVRMKGAEDNAWLLIKKKDDHITEDNILADDHSVLSDKRLEDPPAHKSEKKSGIQTVLAPRARRGTMPHGILPMLAKLAAESFDRAGWIFEIKWDGIRAIAEVKANQSVSLYSRNGLSLEAQFPGIVDSLKNIHHDIVLDGEIVALDEAGISRFQLLQNWQRHGKGELFYYVFDMLYCDGRDFHDSPLIERKKIVRDIIQSFPNIRLSDHVEEKGIAFFREAKRRGLEGIMAKNGASTYREGARTSDWLKIKIINQQEAIIAGFTEPRGGRKYFGALVLGVYDGDDLVYIGHTGGGFDERGLAALKEKLVPLTQKTSPFQKIPKTNAPVTWVKPQLVCEVKFQEWTENNQMRQPIFLGLREDKSPREVRREKAASEQNSLPKKKLEEAAPGEPEITNPNKVFWPKEGYTKGDVIEYYRNIAPYILPYLKDRPESLNRYPSGINGKSFYQKDVDHMPPDWVKTERIYSESNDRDLNYLICNDERTLIYMANLGCIELHPWSSRLGHLDRPDYAIFDLDLGEDIHFEAAIEAARELKKIFDALNLPSYCKTSGLRGLHILVPMGAQYTYEQVRQFAEIIVRLVHEKLPKTTSIERDPRKRRKKVYLDYLQNGKGKTIAAPYCIRPWPGAPVSTPLAWDEVKKGLKPSNFTIKNTAARLKKRGDIWNPLLKEKISLQSVLKVLKKSASKQ